METIKDINNLRTKYKILLESNDTVMLKEFMQTHGISKDNIDLILGDELNNDELASVAGGCQIDERVSKEEVIAQKKLYKINDKKRETFFDNFKSGFAMLFNK
ncbi:MAG: hypothetical protein U9O56_10460 [Campylobacterota bacterium]|nr:hypothetical protein [Campylobacterota bacterium]